MTTIKSVRANNRRRVFELRIGATTYGYPYAKCDPQPTTGDRVATVEVDAELAREAVTYVLASGKTGFVHAEQVLEYHRDPAFVRDQVLYELTLAAQRALASAGVSTREVIRRLGTSASQFYRLVDQTNYQKSVDQMLMLLYVLDCDVTVSVVKQRA